MSKHSFLNHNYPLPLALAADAGSAVDSDWISLKESQCVTLLVVLSEGRAGAADDTTVVVRQASAAVGTGAKAFAPRRWYRKEDATDLPSTAALGWTERADGATNGDMTSILAVEIDASELDVENDFSYVSIRVPGVGSSGREATVIGIAGGMRHATDPTELRNPLA